MTMAIILDAQT